MHECMHFLKSPKDQYVLQLHAVFSLVEAELGHGLSKFAKKKNYQKFSKLREFFLQNLKNQMFQNKPRHKGVNSTSRPDPP